MLENNSVTRDTALYFNTVESHKEIKHILYVRLTMIVNTEDVIFNCNELKIKMIFYAIDFFTEKLYVARDL